MGAARRAWQRVCVNDYERIARIIEYLDERHTEQPDLAELAEHIGISPFHFHRLFSTWAGVTPKDFLQCLTLSHARELLRRGQTTLEAALNSGLSGPGRLHDLCVSLEAATPGEIKSGGAGLAIRFGFAETPFGKWLVGETARGICHLSFLDGESSEEAVAEMRENWPAADFTRDDAVARELSRSAFSKNQVGAIPFRAFVRGTEFQVRVWRALLQVPAGSAVSYGRVAHWIGRPEASRAVGAAVGQNSIAYLIPCHRVIRETGVMKGYRWGTTRKRALLAWESARQAF